ncbi:RNA polymerase sigma-70 factor [Herbidospora mongoliensis]|uniref:RNA polymerase sigma-70 factor n=1 Tax=Herbidospora mongoliensis TaxID=688067 RepID=UPI000830ACD1|nr:RNA polymerase sigma-70 factor [Herbidospora mongoliensis]
MDSLENAASVFTELRPRLFGIAYRMLGSAAEAEDVVQDVWLRWQVADRSAVQSPPAFLATIATRLSINVAQSARSRRESYIGPWLPEPIDTSMDPTLGAERGEALEFAFLLLLERLSPTERAAYVLREAFVYPYEQIAEIIQVSAANARQLVSRARKRLSTERREPIDRTAHRQLLETFLDAAQSGDVHALESLFAKDVVSLTDGNGILGAARLVMSGVPRVTKFITAFAPRFWPGATITYVEANGQPAVYVPARDKIGGALLILDASPDGIHHLLWVMNPDKLSLYERSRHPGEPT